MGLQNYRLHPQAQSCSQLYIISFRPSSKPEDAGHCLLISALSTASRLCTGLIFPKCTRLSRRGNRGGCRFRSSICRALKALRSLRDDDCGEIMDHKPQKASPQVPASEIWTTIPRMVRFHKHRLLETLKYNTQKAQRSSVGFGQFPEQVRAQRCLWSPGN